jgi:hypothetical protein
MWSVISDERSGCIKVWRLPQKSTLELVSTHIYMFDVLIARL